MPSVTAEEQKLRLICAAAGVAVAEQMHATEHARVYRGEYRVNGCHGIACALKIVRGPHEFIGRQDGIIRACLMRGGAWGGGPGRAPAGALTPILHHGNMAFPDGDEAFFLVTPLLEGSSLADALYWGVISRRRGARVKKSYELSRPWVCEQLSLLADGLARLRGQCLDHAGEPVPALVNFDLKPQNIFLCSAHGAAGGFRPCLLDLDTLVLFEEGFRDARVGVAAMGLPAGAPPGTPGYSAPELFGEQALVTLRSDAWALGIIACEALSGSWPYATATIGEQGEASVHAWLAWCRKNIPAKTAYALLDNLFLYRRGGDRRWINLPAEALSTLVACMDVAPGNRPELTEIARALHEVAVCLGEGEQALRA
ncbi:protein kinase domain-containing protein [Enorma phocaeensis]|uniref:protein kinase domain-containing protein n=1 Tax=Enorma phocaeensis TaxID=1871019 RepID=UPI000C820C9E|nr:hypothetical protein [Enorma phocaeensis]